MYQMPPYVIEYKPSFIFDGGAFTFVLTTSGAAFVADATFPRTAAPAAAPDVSMNFLRFMAMRLSEVDYIEQYYLISEPFSAKKVM
jgi:hypothetical protein